VLWKEAFWSLEEEEAGPNFAIVAADNSSLEIKIKIKNEI
jgi:hypothetical protein